MSFGFKPLRRRFERLLATFSVVAVLMSMMVVFAPAALAHHADLTGSVACAQGDPIISYTASSWTATNSGGRYNSNIGVYVDSESGTSFDGDETKIGSGKFLPGVAQYPVPDSAYGQTLADYGSTQSPSAQFSGTFNASAYEGQTIYLKSRADAKWWNNQAAGSVGESNDVIQVQVPVCNQNVTVTPTVQACRLNQGVPLGGVSFVINPASGATVVVTGPGGPFNFSGAGGSQALAPGQYNWSATAASGFQLSGPSSGNFTVLPCGASTVVVSGACAVGPNGVPLGQVQITINPTSGATVVVSGPGGPYNFSGGGGTQALAPGSYTWTATAASGFSLTGQSSGSFTIPPCDATAVVVSGECVIDENGTPRGSVEVTIDPESGATVIVSGPGGPFVFDEDGGTQLLAPGDYTWEAEAEPGYELDQGESSGEFTVEPCEATVVVTGRCLLDGNAGFGQLAIDISTDGAASVKVFDGATLIATSTESGTVSVPEGKTYTWSAVSNAGFELSGNSEGSVAVDECSKSIIVDASTACLDNIPYLIWDITPVNFDSNAVTVSWLDLDPGDPLYSTVHGLQGQMVWPGAVVEGGVVVDWPGWLYVNPDTMIEVPLGTEGGIWAPGADGYETLRPQTSVGFSVNPTTVVVVDYPPGDPNCDGPPPAIFVEIGSMCLADTPYLTYESTLSGNVQSDLTADIHWFNKNGVEQIPADDGQAYSGLPLSGTVLWPGARVGTQSKPVDWPGWTFVPDSGSAWPIVDSTGSVTDLNGATGKWVQGNDGFLWSRETGAYVTISVNPTSDPVEVSYPPGTPTCKAGPPDEVEGEVVLPFTGMDSEQLLGVSILLLGVGIYLIHIARRGEEG